MQKMQTDEVQTGFVGGDAALVARLAVGFEDRHVDPREAVSKPGAPDHVRDVEHASVLEHWQAVHHPSHLRYSLNARSEQLFRLHTDKRSTLRENLAADTASDRRSDRQQAVEHEAEDEPHEEEASGQPMDAERHVSGVPARDPRWMLANHLDGDLGARVPGANEEHRARLKLR